MSYTKKERLAILLQLVTDEIGIHKMLPKRVQKWESNVNRLAILQDIKHDLEYTIQNGEQSDEK